MSRTAPPALLLLGLAVGAAGCQHPSVSAVSLNPHYCDHKFAFLYDPCKEPEGIPFYLPKPLLIISKNFRNIEEAKVGLTDTAPIPNYYDDQAKYADLNARTNFQGLDGNPATGAQAASPDQKFPDKDATHLATTSGQHIFSPGGAPVAPGAVVSDGLKPEAFFTYHVIFVPDLTQKYGLKVKGGAGEIRAAMNLVNGWQFTGLGPYYMKDSSTAQNTLAGGITANLAASGVADVVKAVASLKPGAGAGPVTASGHSTERGGRISLDADKVRAVADALRELNPRFLTIPAYAEISIYEPYLSAEGTMEWKLIAEKCFDRNVVATDFQPNQVIELLKSASVTPPAAAPGGGAGTVTSTVTGQADKVVTPKVAAPVHTPNDKDKPPPDPTPTAPAPATPPAAPAEKRPGSEAAAPKDDLDPPPSNLRPIPDGGDAGPLRTRGSARGDRGPRRGGELPPLPGAGGTPSVEGPRVSRPPGAGERDDALVRTQLGDPAAPGSSASVVSALTQSRGVGATTISVAASPGLGSNGDVLTTDRSPSITVSGLPARTQVMLFRDGGPTPVDTNTTGAGAGDPVTLIDRPAASLPPGSHVYTVAQVGAGGQRVTLPNTPLTVTVVPPDTSAADTTGRTAPPAGTVSAVASSELMRQFTSQIVPLITASRAAAVPAATPGVVVPVPVAGAAPGNQVTLNQYFGKTHLGGVAAPEPRRISLFHRKETPRRTIRTLDLGNLDAEATALAAPANPQAPSSPGPAQPPAGQTPPGPAPIGSTNVQPRTTGTAAPPGSVSGPGAAPAPGG